MTPGQRQDKKGICVVCSSIFEFTPGKRRRVTCSGKCRKIKYLNATDLNRKRASLISSRMRLAMRLKMVEEELVKLGWREND